jgi:hypothetical protein
MSLVSRHFYKRRGFYKRESRCFCPCELCRLSFGRMLYNRFKSGEPLNSYHPSGWPERARLKRLRKLLP